MGKTHVVIMLSFVGVAAVSLLAGIGSRQQLVTVETPTTPSSADLAAQQNTKTTTAPSTVAAPKAISRPALSTKAPAGQYQTQQRPVHDNQHRHEQQIKLPVEIRAYIEQQRIPRSQLAIQPDSNGILTLDTKGQYETVSIATLDDNGDVIITERQIQPINDGQN